MVDNDLANEAWEEKQGGAPLVGSVEDTHLRVAIGFVHEHSAHSPSCRSYHGGAQEGRQGEVPENGTLGTDAAVSYRNRGATALAAQH